MTEALQDLISLRFAGLPVGRMILFIALAGVSLALQKIIASIMRRASGKSETVPADFLRSAARPAGVMVLWGGLYFSLKLAGIPPALSALALKLLLFLVLAGAVWTIWALIDAVASGMARKASATESRLDDQMVPLLRKLCKILAAALGVAFFLQMLGYPVSGIIAGLGIGGLAVALAAQDSLSGFFSSLVLFLDKPFMVGDFIQIGGTTGTVEEIGFRSTRIRTMGKTLVSIPNKEVVDSTIDNLSRRPMRRTEITLRITYDCTPERMESLLEGLRRLLREHPMVHDEALLVHFTEFGAYSLNVEMKFFITTTEFEEWLGAREDINLQVMRAVHGLGLDFAFPTQTVHLGK